MRVDKLPGMKNRKGGVKMGWIILSSISGAIVAYAVTKVMYIKFLSELETVEKKHREELLSICKERLGVMKGGRRCK